MEKYQKITAIVSLGMMSLGVNAAPNVATDITPVHSLVSQVMAGVGTPDLLIQSGASPHNYSLSPSEAEALQEADLVFWIGEGLTPWLERSLDNLSPTSTKIELLEAQGTTTYAFREGATFGAHEDEDDGHEDEAHEDEAHEDEAHEDEAHEDEAHEDEAHEDEAHEDEAHEDEAHEDEAHEDEAHEDEAHEDEHHHDHSGVDPHAWLDPANGKVWLDVIASALAEKDPENASQYLENAAISKAKIDTATLSIENTIAQLQDKQFIVFHDAYQYFEKRFGIMAAGSISISDASKPSPGRIAEIRQLVEDLSVSCVFTEPQYNPGIVNAVFGDTGVNTSGVIDPLGSGLVTGTNLYSNLLIEIAKGLQSCLGKK
jgi:zinc transport system substrate-binding protein